MCSRTRYCGYAVLSSCCGYAVLSIDRVNLSKNVSQVLSMQMFLLTVWVVVVLLRPKVFVREK